MSETRPHRARNWTPPAGLLYGDRMDQNLKRLILNWAQNAAMTIAGLTMAVTPLALWASPTLTVFYTVLITCGLACAAVVLLSQVGEEEPRPARRRDDKVALTPRLIRFLQNQRELGRKELPELRRFLERHLKGPPSNRDD